MYRPFGSFNPIVSKNKRIFFSGHMEGMGPFKLVVLELRSNTPWINAWVKRNSIGSSLCQRVANPSKDELENRILSQTKDQSQWRYLRNGNKKRMLTRLALMMDNCAEKEGRGSSKCPLGMTPLISQDQNLNFISNKVSFCLFCVLLFQLNIVLILVSLFYNSGQN